MLGRLSAELERYESLSGEILNAKADGKYKELHDFVVRREGIVGQVGKYIEALEKYRDILDGDVDSETLQTLKRKIIWLGERCGKRDADVVKRLTERRGKVADELKRLTHAGQALKGYSRRPSLPPRFLDNMS